MNILNQRLLSEEGSSNLVNFHYNIFDGRLLVMR